MPDDNFEAISSSDMTREEFERRAAEMKARMLKERARSAVTPPRGNIAVPPDARPGPADKSTEHQIEASTLPPLKTVLAEARAALGNAAQPEVLELIKSLRADWFRTGSCSFNRQGGPDLSVSRTWLARSLLLLNEIIAGVRARGWALKTRKTERHSAAFPEQHSFLVRDDVSIRFFLQEKMRRVERPADPKRGLYLGPQYDWVPTGLFTLEIDSWHAPRRSWRDGKRLRLESVITDFLDNLDAAFANEIEHRKKLRWEEIAKQQRAEADRQLRQEGAAVVVLERMAARFQRAKAIRSFAQAWQEAYEEKNGAIAAGSLEDAWIRWANNVADTLDTSLLPFEWVSAMPNSTIEWEEREKIGEWAYLRSISIV